MSSSSIKPRKAVLAGAIRHNAIVETLTNAPKTFEPIFARKLNHDVSA